MSKFTETVASDKHARTIASELVAAGIPFAYTRPRLRYRDFGDEHEFTVESEERDTLLSFIEQTED